VVLATSPVCHPFSVGYLGNLTCRDCGLTFTASWAGGAGVDEYRCANDHVVEIGSADGMLLRVDGSRFAAISLVELRGRCPICSEELATGLLPSCPVCGGRDHHALVSGTFS
jgi:hypothetical protein